MTEFNVDAELDCRGLSCPIPILKTKKALDAMSSGQILKMISTDPGTVDDISTWVKRTGHELLDTNVSGPQYVYLIRKK